MAAVCSCRSATPPAGTQTFGGGRYLLGTIRYANLGCQENGVVVDFNDAYNPSCAHNPRWICPLAPPENRLRVPILTGELAFQSRRNEATPFQLQIKIRVLNGVPGRCEIVVRL
jgi:hypothetical protein